MERLRTPFTSPTNILVGRAPGARILPSTGEVEKQRWNSYAGLRRLEACYPRFGIYDACLSQATLKTECIQRAACALIIAWMPIHFCMSTKRNRRRGWRGGEAGSNLV